MPAALIKRLSNLLCVKSIVTLILTVVFADLAVTGRISSHDFLTIFSVVIAFYFGTQSERVSGHRAEIVLTVIPGPRPAPSSH